jgi:hypothetical protein
MTRRRSSSCHSEYYTSMNDDERLSFEPRLV